MNEQLLEHIENLEIIDTHEHLSPFEKDRDRDTDVLKEYLTHYFSCDLLSSGLSEEGLEQARDPSLGLRDRWKLVEPHWEACRFTGYGRALDRAAEGLYGFPGINRETVEPLNESFMKSLEPGHFKYVLKKKSLIRISILHDLEGRIDCDPSFFRSVLPIDSLVLPKDRSDITGIETVSGIRIRAFEDYLEACVRIILNAREKGAIGLKSTLAYQRSIRFDRWTAHEAERAFNEIFKTRHLRQEERPQFTVGVGFQDFVMHHILRIAERESMVMQVHTGIQEGSGNIISNSDPALLSNLFVEYPDLRFDVFHMGFPFQHVLAVCAKNFPNVFIDLCWAHIVSPLCAVRMLEELVDTVPVNKILGFGGDYCFVDGVYGHQYMARRNICEALSRQIDRGRLGLDDAEHIASMILYENPSRLFGLTKIE